MVTLPNGDPPVGGSKMPLTKKVFCAPLGKVIGMGESTERWWLSA
jgi:hypothetical protein